MESIENIESIYSSICDGYSINENNSLKYIHPTPIDEARCKSIYKKEYDWAISTGLKPEKDIISDLIGNGKWSHAKELMANDLRKKISGLERSKSNIKDFAAIDPIYDDIKRFQSQLNDLLVEKYNLIENSAEQFAENKVRFKSICQSVLINENGNWGKISEEYLDYVNRSKYNEIEFFFRMENYKISIDSIKNICVKPFFYSIFNLSDNEFNFFGKPIVYLTTFQTNLLQIGRTFAKIATEVIDLPEEYDGNPDKMLMYWYATKNGAAERAKEQENTSSKITDIFHKLRAQGK